jgi:hypothetical protein
MDFIKTQPVISAYITESVDIFCVTPVKADVPHKTSLDNCPSSVRHITEHIELRDALGRDIVLSVGLYSCIVNGFAV